MFAFLFITLAMNLKKKENSVNCLKIGLETAKL